MNPWPGAKGVADATPRKESMIRAKTGAAGTVAERLTTEQAMDGLLIVDKPEGISSAKAVARVKRALAQPTKVGHAGTLDPFASGVLLIMIGKATTLCERLMDKPKQYVCTIKLGSNTETDDPESPEQPVDCREVPEAVVSGALSAFVGQIHQRPPAFSAIKVGGRRSYQLARTGQPVQLESRIITIYSVKLLEYLWPHLELAVTCGRGTYIRALARDIGFTLGTGAFCRKLRRTAVGKYRVESALSLEGLTDSRITDSLIPLSTIEDSGAEGD
jgi:tRNA pseudouridine55 synthase